MAKRSLIHMNPTGRLTLPVSARRELDLEGDAQFEMEISEGVVILRPVITMPREDAWAYTPEHLDRMERARQETQEGRIQRLTEDELEALTSNA